MKIHCKYDKLVSVNELKAHPKNRNKHSDEQVIRLAKILNYQGLRAPIVVSKRSGYIVKGHGTLQSIKLNQWKNAPVVYQDFEDEEQEYLFVQSDNAIAAWAELDLSAINEDITELGPFDIDLVGIKNFNVVPEVAPKSDPKDKDTMMMNCPNCGVLIEGLQPNG
jgi:ParB-like nuclease domain